MHTVTRTFVTESKNFFRRDTLYGGARRSCRVAARAEQHIATEDHAAGPTARRVEGLLASTGGSAGYSSSSASGSLATRTSSSLTTTSRNSTSKSGNRVDSPTPDRNAW